MRRNIILTITLAVAAISAMSFIVLPVQDTYKKKEVPAEYTAKKNPHVGDKSLHIIGLRNFNRHCVSCHGKKGKGDGVMARNMKTTPGDLSSPNIEKYNDGELYYLSFIGIGDRPDFMKLIPNEEDRWAVVNYVRTLKAK